MAEVRIMEQQLIGQSWKTCDYEKLEDCLNNVQRT